MYPKINIFNNFPFILRRKTSNSIIIWLFFLIVSTVLFLIIAFNYKFHQYDTYLGYVRNDNVVIYVEDENIGILSNSNLIVDKIIYDFKIINISDNYYLSDNKKYREVIIFFDMTDKLKIENNILNLSFEKELTTIYEEIKKGIKIWTK